MELLHIGAQSTNMAKIFGPCFSISAKGSFGNCLTYRKTQGRDVVHKYNMKPKRLKRNQKLFGIISVISRKVARI